MGNILIFSENDRVAYSLLGKGLEIASEQGSTVGAAVLGANLKDRADEYVNQGAQRVYLPAQGKEMLESNDAAAYAEAIAQIAREFQATVILLGCTRQGKELAGRLAQKLEAGCINDVNGMVLREGQILCERYALGGATVMTQTVTASAAVISVMPGTYEAVSPTAPAGEIVEINLNLKPDKIQVMERQTKAADSVDIAEAEILVCVGMGLGDSGKMPMIEDLAGVLGAEIGSTKPVATDQKWVSEERLIGLSGKKCKPQLAICLGISGEIQFVVGIREAKTIVAVNTDENAPIFSTADYGIVGDLNQVVPKLTALIKS